MSAHSLDSVANISNREWLTNSFAPPRTAPSSSNPKSLTVYTTSNTNILPSDPNHLHKPHCLNVQPTTNSLMTSDFNNLFILARSKLHLSISSKDNCSLHRWVLLKNSIINSPSLTSSSTSELPEATPAYPDDEYDDDNVDEVLGSVAEHNFMFPDAGNLVESQPADLKTSEAQWLDSLLETLGDDDEDEYGVDSDPQILPTDDEDDHLFSPSASPISSSDDLPMHPYYHSPSTYPYPVPYPPFQPPISRPYVFNPPFESSISSLPPPYDDPLPYYDSDDVDYLSVPDAIEDTSDDESDTPPTPSLGRSSSSLSLDAASIPQPQENSGLRHSVPRVYIDKDSSYFSPFELDPLPFSDDVHNSYNPYQEC